MRRGAGVCVRACARASVCLCVGDLAGAAACAACVCACVRATSLKLPRVRRGDIYIYREGGTEGRREGE